MVIKVDYDTVVVFDLDDTLYNELDYLKSAYKSIAVFLEPHNWHQLYVKMFSIYRNKQNVFEHIAQLYKIDIDVLIEMYRNHKPVIQLVDGALDILNAIKSKNGKLGLITDGRSKTQRAKIESLGLSNYFDRIIISEEIGSEKPNVINYKIIQDTFPNNTYYYIADNLKKDFIAPNNLGWKTIMLIDNGKNIHFDSCNLMNVKYLPHNYIFSLKDVRII